MPLAANQRGLRHVLIDTNFWKSFIHSRLATPMGDPGCLSLFKDADHQMLADHLSAEQPTSVTAKERTVEQWDLIPNRDNHFLDCLELATVAASVCGSVLTIVGENVTPPKKRVKLSALARARSMR
jgi:hypothetical protein